MPAPGLLANDADLDLDPLQAVPLSGPASGSLALAPSGAFVYTPTLNFNGLITFTYRVTDGLAFSNQAAVTVTVSPANDPPLLDLNGPDPGTGFGAIFRQGQGPVPVASPSLTVQDPDDEVLVGAIITIANRLNGTAEMLAAQAAGAVTVTDNPATGVLTLTGPAPRADFQQVLSTVTYANTAFPLRLEARGIIFSISDGTNVSFATATVAIVERPPVYLPLVARHAFPDCSPDQYEPNDSPAQAYQLTANTTLRANFCEQGDRDEYKLTLSSTTNPLDITLSNIPQGCDYDLYLFRVPNSGDPIQVAKSKQNGNLNEHISYVPSQAADYLLLVYAYLKGTQARGSFYQLDIILQ